MLDRVPSEASVEVHPETARQKYLDVVLQCHDKMMIRQEDVVEASQANLGDAIQGGEALYRIRRSLAKRGEWMIWVRANVPFSQRKVNDWLGLYFWRDQISDVANISRALSTIRVLRRKKRHRKLRDNPPPLPDGKYAIIVADPPWPLEDLDYPTMSIEEICALPVTDLAADDAVLFLWRVCKFDEEAHRVIRAWNFVYAGRKLVWVKNKANVLHPWMWGKHEDCLIATRGKPELEGGQVDVVEARRQRHSEKPQEVFDVIDAMSPAAGPGQKLELFARPDRAGRYPRGKQGWVPFGDEVERWAKGD